MRCGGASPCPPAGVTGGGGLCPCPPAEGVRGCVSVCPAASGEGLCGVCAGWEVRGCPCAGCRSVGVGVCACEGGVRGVCAHVGGVCVRAGVRGGCVCVCPRVCVPMCVPGVSLCVCVTGTEPCVCCCGGVCRASGCEGVLWACVPLWVASLRLCVQVRMSLQVCIYVCAHAQGCVRVRGVPMSPCVRVPTCSGGGAVPHVFPGAMCTQALGVDAHWCACAASAPVPAAVLHSPRVLRCPGITARTPQHWWGLPGGLCCLRQRRVSGPSGTQLWANWSESTANPAWRPAEVPSDVSDPVV